MKATLKIPKLEEAWACEEKTYLPWHPLSEGYVKKWYSAWPGSWREKQKKKKPGISILKEEISIYSKLLAAEPFCERETLLSLASLNQCESLKGKILAAKKPLKRKKKKMTAAAAHETTVALRNALGEMLAASSSKKEEHVCPSEICIWEKTLYQALHWLLCPVGWHEEKWLSQLLTWYFIGRNDS